MKDDTKLVIGLGFATILCLMSALVYIALSQLKAINQSIASVVEQTNAKTRAANTMRDAIRLRTRSLYVMLSSEDPFELDAQSLQYREYAGIYMGARGALMAGSLDGVERELIGKLDRATRRAQPINDTALALIMEGADRPGILDQVRSARQAQEEVLGLLDRLVNTEKARALGALAVNRDQYRRTRKQLLTLSGATFAICLVIAVLVVRRASARTRHISYQASHDSLTGLINRRRFEEDLRALVKRGNQEDATHALLYMDLDQFKVVNDTCGHAAGDELLRQLSTELKRHIRKADVLARLGGDEFGVLLYDCGGEEAVRIAKNLTNVARKYRFLWQDNRYVVGVSIGLVSIPSVNRDVAELMSLADSACYAAKEEGRNRIYVYNEDDEGLSRRQTEMRLTSRITRALQEDRFALYCQEIVSAQPEGQPSHYEVLVRMCERGGRLLLPGQFIPAAERYGLIGELDQWVLGNALRWLAGRDPSGESMMLAINISGHSLSDRGFLDLVVGLLREYETPGQSLCFEITETCAIANHTAAARFMRVLKERGCLFALDDFGTGLSSFHYLKSLPVDYLKIDGSFIRDLTRDQIDVAMVRAINDIAHVLGKQTIAEFVESEEIWRLVEELGIDYAQGYAIGKPRPLETLVSQASAVA
jgi:diguanylate cyclase (GGDEF)-like protein